MLDNLIDNELGGLHQYEALQQRRSVLQNEIDAIYDRYNAHIANRLQRGDSGFIDFDDMPSDEEYAAYDLPNTPLASLEHQLFNVTVALQDLRLATAQ